MGRWTHVSSTMMIKDRQGVYGNFVAVRFRLKYTPSIFGSFVEMPGLEWKETILMIEKNDTSWWRYDGDQYARNPNSQTFISWVGRYVNAYYAVRGEKYGNDEPARLYDKRGGKIGKNTFDRGLEKKAASDEVQNYLMRNGGILDVLVVDKPGINKPEFGNGVHKERILTFDCGLKGSMIRKCAYQHLIVDAAVHESGWTRTCKPGLTMNPIKAEDLTTSPQPPEQKKAPPPGVKIVKAFTGRDIDGNYK